MRLAAPALIRKAALAQVAAKEFDVVGVVGMIRRAAASLLAIFGIEAPHDLSLNTLSLWTVAEGNIGFMLSQRTKQASTAKTESAMPKNVRAYLLQWATDFFVHSAILLVVVALYHAKLNRDHVQIGIILEEEELRQRMANLQTDWKDQCCTGLSNDWSICLCSFFCDGLGFPVRWVHNMHVSGIFRYWNAVAIVVLFILIQPLTAGLAFACFKAVQRRKIRRMFKMDDQSGSFVVDCCCYLWFTCCTVAQTARHLHEAAEVGHPLYGGPSQGRVGPAISVRPVEQAPLEREGSNTNVRSP